MSVSFFDARLRMPGRTKIPMGVVVDITDDRISFAKGEESLGDWPRGEVEVDVRPDGFHLKFGEEEVVLSVSKADDFARALGVGSQRRPGSAVATTVDLTPPTNDGFGDIEMVTGFAARLQTMSPEERFAGLRQRIDSLSADLTDESKEAADVFGRWLGLLEEINLQLGRGEMPTPVFCKFNTELLEMISSPRRPGETG